MGIIDRLGNVIKSYLAEEAGSAAFDGRFAGGRRSADADLNAAFEELNEYLNTDTAARSKSYTNRNNTYKNNTSQNNAYKNDAQSGGQQSGRSVKLPPESLRRDFETLGVPFGASEADCKAAQKNLLKKHHPDIHAQHEGNRQKATVNAAGINAAFQRIHEWHSGQGGGV